AGASVVAASIAGLQYPVLHAVQTHPEQTTIAYDLVRMSVREGVVLLPRDAYPRQDVGYLARRSTPGDVDALLFGSDPAIAGPFEGARLDALRAAWLTAIRERPDIYLRVRALSALLQLNITSAPNAAYYGAPPPEYGFELLSPRLHQDAVAYLALGSTPDAIGHPGGRLDPAWMYVLLLAVAVAAGLRLRGPAGAVHVLLGAALLAYTVELLLLSPVVTYRYMYPSVVTGTVLAVTVLAGAGGLLRTRLSSSG
ncbi:MAG TPA: hypothetical protein VLW53_09635, partial [Candidatus Eisenbacteria bacterium]|nr:hypothetical protein [Candidatus Eisenbacteria bacterium]